MSVRLCWALFAAALPLCSDAFRHSSSGPRVITLPLQHQRLDGPKLSALGLHSAVGAPASRHLPLHDHGHAYYAPIYLGSDGQELNVLFDTGSANLVVPSAACDSPGCRGHRLFDPQRSTSGSYLSMRGEPSDKDHAQELSISFASGRAAGNAFQDRVCLAGACADRARFLLAEAESDSFSSFHFDGVLGLAPAGKLSMGPGASVLDELVRQGALARRVFAFLLAGPLVQLGGYDETRELTWLRAVQGRWSVWLSNVTAGGKAVDGCAGGCLAELDTGCGGLTLSGKTITLDVEASDTIHNVEVTPEGMADELAEQLGFIASRSQCSLPEVELAAVTFALDGHMFELRPQDYVEISTKDASRCRLAFTDMGGATAPVVLGHPFLSRYYSVFDREQMRIGLARVEEEESGGGPALAAMRRNLAASRAR